MTKLVEEAHVRMNQDARDATKFHGIYIDHHSSVSLQQRPRPRRLLLRMVAVITALAAFTALSAVYAAPWDPKGQGRNDLNPYADDRRLVFENGKFKLLLISDLHYAERESNLAWADWSAINVSYC